MVQPEAAFSMGGEHGQLTFNHFLCSGCTCYARGSSGVLEEYTVVDPEGHDLALTWLRSSHSKVTVNGPSKLRTLFQLGCSALYWPLSVPHF